MGGDRQENQEENQTVIIIAETITNSYQHTDRYSIGNVNYSTNVDTKRRYQQRRLVFITKWRSPKEKGPPHDIINVQYCSNILIDFSLHVIPHEALTILFSQILQL